MKKYLIPLLALSFSALVGYSDSSRPQISFLASEESSDNKLFESSLSNCRAHLIELTGKNATVLSTFDTFIAQLQKIETLSEADRALILASLEFAADKHRTQTRKNKEKTPYISHPIGVATNLMKIGKVSDPAIIIAALLHDTVEDTDATLSEIEKKFGKEVAGYVGEVTDKKDLPSEERKRLQVINAAKKSPGAAQIKMADKLYNLNDLKNNPPEKWTRARIDQYHEWAKSVVDRLPASNPQLKEALDEMIDQYWENQPK